MTIIESPLPNLTFVPSPENLLEDKGAVKLIFATFFVANKPANKLPLLMYVFAEVGHIKNGSLENLSSDILPHQFNASSDS